MKKLVISLTSYPDRIRVVPKVVQSLFAQVQKADEIVLWLSVEEFPGKYEDLPNSLKCLAGKNGFRIEWVKDNLKSHKKYFYALQNQENVVITVDDDMYYASDMVSSLVNSYKKHPCAVSAREVHMIFRQNEEIAPYGMWESRVSEYAGIERMDLCAVGVGGILYPSGCASERWFDRNVLKEAAENQDDLWLKFNEMIDSIPVVYTGRHEADMLIEESQNNALYFSNMYQGENDTCIQKLTTGLIRDYRKVYNDWFLELQSMQEFIAYKSSFYQSKIREIFARYRTEDIYICGAGKYACILENFISECEVEKRISGFLVTEKIPRESLSTGVAIREIREICNKESFVVICGVNDKHRSEMKVIFEQYKSCIWLDVDIQDIVQLKHLRNREEQNQLLLESW